MDTILKHKASGEKHSGAIFMPPGLPLKTEAMNLIRSQEASYYRNYYRNHKAQHKIAVKKWRDKNLEYIKNHREKNKERYMLRDLFYRENNKDRLRLQHKLYYQENKEVIKKKRREYYYRHRETEKLKMRDYALAHKDKLKIYKKKYKSLRHDSGDLTIATIQQVYEKNIKRFGTLTCYLCSKPIAFGKDHLEHKTPLSRGGNNESYNLGISCSKCNISKGSKTVGEFITWRGGEN